MPKEGVTRVLFFVLGSISLLLGAVGIFLPLIPTTPFLLLSVACYLRSSTKMHTWLVNNRVFGQYLSNYREGKGLPMKVKIFTLGILWVTVIYSAFYIIDILVMQFLLIFVAIMVTMHLVLLPTFKRV